MFEKDANIENETAPAREAVPSKWDALYDRIRELALMRSEALLAGPVESEEEFDRGARALRTLMSAAEVARRIKQAEEKDSAAHEETRALPAFTDEDIREVYESVTAQLERIETEAGADGADPDASGDLAARARNGGGEDLVGARS